MKPEYIHKAVAFAVLSSFLGCAGPSPRSNLSNDLVTPSLYYEASCDAVGVNGTQALIIATEGKDVAEALSKARLSAIDAILFKGVKTNVCSVPALVYGQGESVLVGDWLGPFYKGQQYLRFITYASDEPEDVIRLSKNAYKVYTRVSVARNQLRDYLIDNGIIQGIGDVFDQ